MRGWLEADEPEITFDPKLVGQAIDQSARWLWNVIGAIENKENKSPFRTSSQGAERVYDSWNTWYFNIDNMNDLTFKSFTQTTS